MQVTANSEPNANEEVGNNESARVKDNKVENISNSSIIEVCPRCGAELVLRIAGKGNNVGKSFYGCTAFPKCRYTRDI